MGLPSTFFRTLLLLFFCSVVSRSEVFPADAGDTLVVTPVFAAPSPHHLDGLQARPVKRPRVGLVLSGGGARGAAQVGVLKVFERRGVPVDFIAATSMGSIVGGLYAAGWTPEEIDSMARHTDWDEVLSLTAETDRSDLFVDQRLAGERSFLTLRFERLQLVLPSAVSSGQRLTTFLNTLTLQGTYHPSTSFDDLRVPFRAVATDLISGKRVVIRDGSLAEALRASATVPLLFNPIERNGMELVDGGLVDNIPVDVAEEAGCDMVIVVNTSSGLRTRDQMEAPWEVADQIMGIMMQRVKEQQLRMADVIITPDLGDHLSSDFHGLDTLIGAGQAAAEEKVEEIFRIYARKKEEFVAREVGRANTYFPGALIRWAGSLPPDSLRRHIEHEAGERPVTMQDVQEHVNLLYEVGAYSDVRAEIVRHSSGTEVIFRLVARPTVRHLVLTGCHRVSADELRPEFENLMDKPFNPEVLQLDVQEALRLYRSHGLSLARLDSMRFDEGEESLRLVFDDGIIAGVSVEGGVRTTDAFVFSQFPLHASDVFEISKAREGVANINGSQLFEYVYLEVTYVGGKPHLTIRLKERPSQLMRFGIRVDNERKLQGSLDVRDENFRGSGQELGLTLLGGERNFDAMVEFKSRRLFNTSLNLSASGVYDSWSYYRYTDGPPPGENQWVRVENGEYRDVRYGGVFSFGSAMERLGNASIDYTYQGVRTENVRQSEDLEDRFTLSMIRVGTVVDTKNRYPFPTSGINLGLSFEVASKALGGSVTYNAFRGMYEFYTGVVGDLVFHPKITVGFADKTMPLAQQFWLGGRESFFGLHENDSRGRQLFLMNFEFQQALPFTIFFDAYIRARYDLGTISTIPEALKFSTFRHGLGIELALDTPIGPAILAAGKSFYFSKDLPENPIQEGPLLLYFTIGYQLF